MKTVQIPVELFARLIRVYLLDMGTDDDTQAIKTALEAKLDALVRHDTYTAYKTADTPEEREKARQDYLERVGIAQDFRW